MGNKANIGIFCDKVLKKILFNEYFTDKDRNNISRYNNARINFKTQYDITVRMRDEIAEFIDISSKIRELKKTLETKRIIAEDQIRSLNKEIYKAKLQLSAKQHEANEINHNYMLFQDKLRILTKQCSQNEDERSVKNNTLKDYNTMLFTVCARLNGFWGLIGKIFNTKGYRNNIILRDNYYSQIALVSHEIELLHDDYINLKQKQNIAAEELNNYFYQKTNIEQEIEKVQDSIVKLNNNINTINIELKNLETAYKTSLIRYDELSYLKGDAYDPKMCLDEAFVNKFTSQGKASVLAHTFNPWFTRKYDCERIKLFYYSLKLTKEFVLSSHCFISNIRTLLQYWGQIDDGDGRIIFKQPDLEAMLPSLFHTLCLFTPVISSTFASVGRLFKDIRKKGVFGTLIVDEAGQAQPQYALGALYRCKRAMIVGDPKQVEPVVTDDLSLLKLKLRNNYSHIPMIIPYLMDKQLSVQSFADTLNEFGTYGLSNRDEHLWVGCPLLVHRRCIDPMCQISNYISYNNQMKQETMPPNGDILSSLLSTHSEWIDISGKEVGNKNHYVKAQGIKVCQIINKAFIRTNNPDLFIISPFKSVENGIKEEINNFIFEAANDPAVITTTDDIQKWANENIGTVHRFQGKEANEVIFLLGCDSSSEATNAIRWVKPNIVNVAVTRAKYRLYIVGDKAAWRASYSLKTAMDFLDNSHSCL